VPQEVKASVLVINVKEVVKVEIVKITFTTSATTPTFTTTLQIFPQLLQYILRYFLQIEYQETIQTIGKLRIDIKADVLGI
jgi:hypothetical protein